MSSLSPSALAVCIKFRPHIRTFLFHFELTECSVTYIHIDALFADRSLFALQFRTLYSEIDVVYLT